MNEYAATIGQRLKPNGITIAVAESITAGNLQAAFSSVSGSSAYFRGGVTAYCLEAKVKLLWVNEEDAKICNCVSLGVASQMAMGVRELFDSDIGVATTGYAELWPDGNIKEPFAYFAIADNAGYVDGGLVSVPEGLDRVAVQQYVTEYVLKYLVANL